MPKPHLTPSLSRRIELSLFVAFATGMMAIFWYVHLDTHGSHEAIEERTLQEQARQFVVESGQASSGSPAALAPDWKQVYETEGSGFYYSIYDRAGRLLAQSPNLANGEPLPLFDASLAPGQFGKLHFIGPQSIPALATRLPDTRLVVVARKPLDEEAFAESLIEERSEPLWVFLPFGLLAFVIIVLVTRYTLQPLQNASAQAAKIGPGSLDTRIPAADLPSELRPLVEAFNRALDRLTEAYATEKRITANAAHELRTPLSVLSLRLQRARIGKEDVDWRGIEDDLARLARLVSQLLDLARKESSGMPPKTSVNFARIAREAAAGLVPLAEAQDREITMDAAEPINVLGRASDLHDMVRNLIENSLHHGKGRVEVTLSTSTKGRESLARLTVKDEGHLIAGDDPDRLFERFRRGDTKASGSGLGLAIVRQVAASHGGMVQLLPSEKTTFEVELPLQGGARSSDSAAAQS